MALISIEYDIAECGTIKYNHVYIQTNNNAVKMFSSKSFIKDWFYAMKYFINDVFDNDPHLSNSSSINDFFMDGADYDSAYLVAKDNDDFELSYDRKMSSGHIEFFVEKGTKPTWEEFKKIVK